MDFDLLLFFSSPRANYTLRNLFSLTGLACKVVLARAVPRDSTRALDCNKTTPTFTVLFECGRGLHSKLATTKKETTLSHRR